MLSLAGMCLGLYKLAARVGFELTMTANQPRRKREKIKLYHRHATRPRQEELWTAACKLGNRRICG
jgi:hypothetical protein